MPAVPLPSQPRRGGAGNETGIDRAACRGGAHRALDGCRALGTVPYPRPTVFGDPGMRDLSAVSRCRINHLAYNIVNYSPLRTRESQVVRLYSCPELARDEFPPKAPLPPKSRWHDVAAIATSKVHCQFAGTGGKIRRSRYKCSAGCSPRRRVPTCIEPCAKQTARGPRVRS